MTMCFCGQPLHYADPKMQARVQALVDSLGERMPVKVGGRTWMVPRHYIALHGIKAVELPFLGFEEIMEP
ncbi:MAG TPA: hypothetical protein VGG62_12190 [Terracidiphilus sp.]|jgi:hypothetical protein